MLQDEMRDAEMQHNGLVNQMEHEASLNQQKIETLESYLGETKASLNNIHSLNSASMEQQLDQFNKERKLLMEKIENMTVELTRKERELTTLENVRDSLSGQLHTKERNEQTVRAEVLSEKTAMNEKIEALRQKNAEMNDEIMAKRLEYGRESALLE